MWMHTLAQLGWWIVVACLWLEKAGGFIRGIYDRFVLKRFARWVHYGGMRMHTFATLGWWIVVTCRWLVKACFFAFVYIYIYIL